MSEKEKTDILDMFGMKKEVAKPDKVINISENSETTAQTANSQAIKDSNVEYKAFGIQINQKRQIRLSVRTKDGSSTGYAYSELPDYACDNYLFAINYKVENKIILLHGHNLLALEEPFLDERIRYLQEWDIAKFGQPDKEKPIIESIEIIDAAEIEN